MGKLLESVHLADGEELACVMVEPDDPIRPEHVVIMHGAGSGSKTRTLPLAETFAAAGHRAIAFDFSGHGASTGMLSELSLRRRFEQARSVIDHHTGDAPLILVGFSMSGQTVADLTDHYRDRVGTICLCAPAAYAPDAWDVRFGDGFTDLIRQPRSWTASRTFATFRAFAGRAVLALPEHDAVIPPGVTLRIEAALRTQARFQKFVFTEADHRLGLWLAEHPEDRRRLVDLCTSAEGTAVQ
ncbi:alpha/beta hydrolase [Peterkaempfera sp. SMS 1(5)a]|uniref:alpha/beta hydrolase n=1 Tax=Peterkaempfera podocarpi TaxID=3232308 RepID=UPI00366B793C